MKTLIKLSIVLVVLAVCVPAQGEILIYRKTIRGFDCNSLDDQWEAIERKDRGYLVLEVVYNYEEEEKTIDVVNAVQIEYFGNKEDRWFEVYEHEFEVIRADYKGKILWILTESRIDLGVGVQILMLKGLAVDARIGLGRDVLREIARKLQGNNLSDQQLGISHDIETWKTSLRLHSQWTKIANNPNQIDGVFDDAVVYVQISLMNKGYEER